MPVNTKHSEYLNSQDMWNRCNTVIGGEDSVKEAGTKYLPKLANQDDDEYNAYKQRASFFSATKRTVEGIVGMIFRRPMRIKFPDLEWIKSAGQGGISLEALARKVTKHVISLGRTGLLLDLKDGESVKPFIVQYGPESIINWRIDDIGGAEKLSLVVLQECDQVVDSTDQFKMISNDRWLVLELNGFDDRGVMISKTPIYRIQVWRKKKGKGGDDLNSFEIESTKFPKIRGQYLNYIPFVFVNPNDLSVNIERSPVADLTSINLSHYRNSADLEHGRHYTALPTPWVAGFKLNGDEKLTIGSQVAWVSEDPNANAGFLEFTGQGLHALEEALTQKENQMAVLGARLLESQKNLVESGDTQRQRKVGEDSIIATIAGTIDLAFVQVLSWAKEWLSKTGDVEVELNKDYSAIIIDPQMITALLGALQSGRISWDTFVYNLAKGEVLPDGRTAEQELELINNFPGMPIPGNEMDLDEEEEEIEEEENK